MCSEITLLKLLPHGAIKLIPLNICLFYLPAPFEKKEAILLL